MNTSSPPTVVAGSRLDLVLVSVEQLLSRDGTRTPVPLAYPDPEDVLHPDRSPIRFRIKQVRADPTINPWLLRLAVLRGDTPTIVGLVNFHDRPDDRGMVEIGYSVLPSLRRRGFGREMAETMWAFAASHPDVQVLRASVSPDNAPSRAIIEGAGFLLVGEQMDPEDGLELIFELAADAYQPPGGILSG